MDYIATKQGIKLVGQGEAVIVDVREGSDDNHQVRVRHPDFGETQFIPYIQTAGLYRVPALGSICYVFGKENFKDYPMAWGSKLHESAVKALIGARDNKITVLYSTAPDGTSISHKVELDDGDNRGVRVTTAGGNKAEFKDTEEITIEHIGGAIAELSAENIKLNIGGSTVTLKAAETHVLVGQSDVEVKPAETNIKVGAATIKVTPAAIMLTVGGSTLVMNAAGLSMAAGAAQMEMNASGMSMGASGSTVELGANVSIQSSNNAAMIDGVTVKTHTHLSNTPGKPTGTPQ